MKGTGRRIAAACAALALVAGLLPAQALATAQDMAAGGLAVMKSQASGSFVADNVYGVFGGQYALMLQTVEYQDGEGEGAETHTATVADVVRADGTVTLHTSDAPEQRDEVPGAWTDYDSSGVYPSRFFIRGYFEIEQKSTGKVGLFDYEGRQVLPFEYDDLEVVREGAKGGANAVYVGATVEGETGHLAIMDASFALVGKVDFPVAAGDVPYMMSAFRFGDYVRVIVYTHGGGYTVVAQKEGSGYKKADDVAEWLDGNIPNESALVAKTDGKVHYIAPGGADMAIADSEGVSYGSLFGSFAYISRNGEAEYYSLTYDGGKKLDFDGWGIVGAVDDSLVLRPSAGIYPGNGNIFAICNDDGAVVRQFSAHAVGIVRKSFSTDYQDGAYLYRLVEEGDAYRMVICDVDGRIVKDLGPTFDSSARSSLSFNILSEYDKDGDTVPVGYKVFRDASATGEDMYFDLDFNRIPAEPSASAPVQLVDGTDVYAHASSVTDSAGDPVVIGGYTLGIAADSGYYANYNAVKHGNADLWWSTDAAGKWGAVDSSGNVKVPFEYESYFDAGHAASDYAAFDAGHSDTDYALVKKDGAWSFLKVAESSGQGGGGGREPSAGDDPTGDPVKDGPAAWTRFAGENAYGTMAKIVEAGWPDGSGAVVVATFDGYWDALTASGLAGFLGCPVLMTGTNSLSATTRAEIERLGARTAFVAGGTAAVSAGVEAELSAMGLAVVRAAGDNAAGTARDAYEKSKSYGAWGTTAIVATADGYWDALAMSPYSYCMHAPIFLAQEPAGGAMRLDADTLTAIRAGGFDTVLVAGGTAAVSADVEGQLSGLAVERLAGETAVETSRAIAAYCAANGMSKAKVAVATTDGYWDALTGAALCGKTRTPMVLASPANAAGAADGFVSSEASTIAVGYIFGGDAAVAPASEIALREATK